MLSTLMDIILFIQNTYINHFCTQVAFIENILTRQFNGCLKQM